MKVGTGLDVIESSESLQKQFPGKIGYLAHAASVDHELKHGILVLKELFGSRFTKIFSPQHGLVGDVQDNMIESDHIQHPYFGLPIYSLYSETRKPSHKMLEGLDHVFIDLQDVGTRIYTYIYTMTYMMEACGEMGIQVVILDRPNPINGLQIEGNMLDPAFSSFVGRHPLPMRHAMTIGEIAEMAKRYWGINCKLKVVSMDGWQRSMHFRDTGLPWVLPSPNLATPEAAMVFPGSVLFEGTNISEGRGTTRSLEIVGHPSLEPYSWLPELQRIFEKCGLAGFVLRPVNFIPTFQKHMDESCGGYQIHVTNPLSFQSWKVGQLLCQALYNRLGPQFEWKKPPYEYEYENLPIDILNGSDLERLWIENNESYDQLYALELAGRPEFEEKRNSVLLY